MIINIYIYSLAIFPFNNFDKTTNKPTWNFKLKEWIWFSQFADGKLTYLGCKDNNGKVRFQFGKFNNELKK